MSPVKQISVAAVGDVLDVNTWSNIPWYFYNEGLRQGLFNQPWRLDTGQFKTSRLLWNLKQVVTGKGKGGYQYSKSFLDKAEGSIDPSLFSSTVISFNQVFPRASSVIRSNGKIYYYIDITLYDLFRETSYLVDIPEHVRRQAIETERENYEKAAGVVSMANWVQSSLRDFYKLDPKKIFTILPGANLPAGSMGGARAVAPGAGITRDLVIGFVGKDWKRKGLGTCLDVRDILESKGYKVKVKVIGHMPPELAGRSGVEYCGFINKATHHTQFINELRSCDLGCLFSQSEALGISVLEFLSLGVPVIGYAHQGTLDTLLPGATIRFDPADKPEWIASMLAEYINDPTKFSQLQEGADNVRNNVTWESTVNRWSQLLKPGS